MYAPNMGGYFNKCQTLLHPQKKWVAIISWSTNKNHVVFQASRNPNFFPPHPKHLSPWTWAFGTAHLGAPEGLFRIGEPRWTRFPMGHSLLPWRIHGDGSMVYLPTMDGWMVDFYSKLIGEYSKLVPWMLWAKNLFGHLKGITPIQSYSIRMGLDS